MLLAFSQGRVALGGWTQARPLAAEIVRADGTARWISAPYTKIASGRAEGILVAPGGSRLRVIDLYRASKDGFDLSRTVRVLAVGAGEAAFATRYALDCHRIEGYEAFLPGVAYRRNAAAPKDALASDLDAPETLVREDRLPLPLAMARDPREGTALTMFHMKPDGATFAGERGPGRIVDARMRFGSLGFLASPTMTAVAFQYPGSEGAARRSHPLRVGFEQRYALHVSLRTSNSYAEAVRTAWRKAFDAADPQPPKADVGKVYRAGMDLLAHHGVSYDGVPSMPFQARLPDGTVIDSSSQMGFVGKALPCAALMLRDAKDRHDDALKGQAEALIDLWVERSTNPSGVPKTWYDVHRDGTISWRPYPTHLRVACDGMRGVLDAYRIEHKAGWLAYARGWGDFLVAHQTADGSLAGRWKADGTVDRAYTNATDHAIPFLVELYGVTRDERYRVAALKAGEFCLATVDVADAYVGGTPDNPNVTDKEAGVLATQAFLALYDLTKDARWIAPAARAATFAETWTYAWNVPLPADDPGVVFPRNRTTLGVSLIATGHSGADAFMALAVYDFVRLAKLTRDDHFLRFARFLQRGTAQMLDWDGTLGYAYPGLMMEALSLAPPRGHGVKGWLPWLSVAVLDPLVRLRDAYGTFDADRIGLTDRPGRG